MESKVRQRLERGAAGEVLRWEERTGSRPQEAGAWLGLGDALMQRSRDRLDSADYDRAEAAYLRARSLDSREPGALAGLAWVANSRHEFPAGKEWARQALALDPRSPAAHALWGDAALELGDFEEALEHYQAGLDLRPDLSSYSRAAQLVWRMGDARRGQFLMRKAVEAGGPHAENTAWCQAELALMLFHEGALRPAEQQLEVALRAVPNHPRALEVMGQVQLARTNYPAAMELLERSVEVAPPHSSLALLAVLHRVASERAEAELAIQRVLDFHAAQGPGHTHAGGTNPPSHRHGDPELARFLADHDRELDRALIEAEAAHRTSNNPMVIDTLAWCLFKVGRDAEAARLIRQALGTGMPEASIHFHAGLIFHRRGDMDKARTHLTRALGMNPHFHPLHARVAASLLQELAANASHPGEGSR